MAAMKEQPPRRRTEALFMESSGGVVTQNIYGNVIVHSESNASKICGDQHTGARPKTQANHLHNKQEDRSSNFRKDDSMDAKFEQKLEKSIKCQSTANEIPAIDTKDEKMQNHVWNHVWMNVKTGEIVSLFCKKEETLNEVGSKYLEAEYHRLSILPSELVTNVGGVVTMGFQCNCPSNMTINPESTQWHATGTQLSKRMHLFPFEPEPNPNKVKHTGPYKILHKVQVFDLKNQLVEGGGFTDSIRFAWPLSSRGGDETVAAGQQAESACSTKQNIKVSNVKAKNVYIAGTGERFDYRQGIQMTDDQLHRLMSWTKANYTVQQDGEYLSKMKTMFGQAFSTKTQEITPEGGIMELDGCQIVFLPGAVQEKTAVRMMVFTATGSLLDSAEMISPSLKCKPSAFIKPVHVSLPSWFTSKSGKETEVKIMSKTGNADWEQILKATVKDGKVEYDVGHFCSHVAAVSTEDAKDGLYHLLNDVWMHEKSGRIISFFCKTEKDLDKARGTLADSHKSIISLPRELIVTMGSTIVVEFQHPQSFKMLSIDGINSRLEVNHTFLKKNISMLLFRPDHYQENIQWMDPSSLTYQATILDSTNQTIDGFSAPLRYTWPTTAFEQSSASTEVHQEASTSDLQDNTDSNVRIKQQHNVTGHHEALCEEKANLDKRSSEASSSSGITFDIDRMDDKEASSLSHPLRAAIRAGKSLWDRLTKLDWEAAASTSGLQDETDPNARMGPQDNVTGYHEELCEENSNSDKRSSKASSSSGITSDIDKMDDKGQSPLWYALQQQLKTVDDETMDVVVNQLEGLGVDDLYDLIELTESEIEGLPLSRISRRNLKMWIEERTVSSQRYRRYLFDRLTSGRCHLGIALRMIMGRMYFVLMKELAELQINDVEDLIKLTITDIESLPLKKVQQRKLEKLIEFLKDTGTPVVHDSIPSEFLKQDKSAIVPLHYHSGGISGTDAGPSIHHLDEGDHVSLEPNP